MQNTSESSALCNFIEVVLNIRNSEKNPSATCEHGNIRNNVRYSNGDILLKHRYIAVFTSHIENR